MEMSGTKFEWKGVKAFQITSHFNLHNYERVLIYQGD